MDQQSAPPLFNPQGPPVKISVSNGKAYIFNIQDVERLRVDHHICGLLTGTLPQLAQQNVFLGLPLVLLPEEVYVLVTHALAVLVDAKLAHSTPTPEQALKLQEEREARIAKERVEVWEADKERKEAMEEKFRERIDSARAKKAAAAANTKAASATTIDANSTAPGMLSPSPPSQPPPDANLPYFIPTPLASSHLPLILQMRTLTPRSNQHAQRGFGRILKLGLTLRVAKCLKSCGSVVSIWALGYGSGATSWYTPVTLCATIHTLLAPSSHHQPHP